jgi:hypothetical protein
MAYPNWIYPCKDNEIDPHNQPAALTKKQKSVSYSQLSKYRFNDAVSQLGW